MGFEVCFGALKKHIELPRLVDESICYCSKRYLPEMYNEECEERARCLVAFDLVSFELPVRGVNSDLQRPMWPRMLRRLLHFLGGSF